MEISNEQMAQYEPLVRKVYKERYAKYFSYLKEDLLQCGRWGLWNAFNKYPELKVKCTFTYYAYCNIRCKMWHYIDHEKHHITKETNEIEFDEVPSDNKDFLLNLDTTNAINSLTESERTQLTQWANYVPFREQNFSTKQTAYNYLQRTFKKLKEKITL